MHKVETQHLELQVKHFTWLHMVEVQHKVTVSLVQMDQGLTIEQELAQVEAVKENGRTHGAVAEVAEVQVELDKKLTHSTQTLEDMLDILADQETLQKAHQVADQVLLTQMTQDIDHTEAEAVLDYMDLLAVAEVQQEDQVAQGHVAEEMATETILELLALTHNQTQVQVVAEAEQILVVQEYAKLPIG
jgi:hypothetical protein